MSLLDITIEALGDVVRTAVTTVIFLPLLLLIMALSLILNYVFGINIGSWAFDITTRLFESLREFIVWLVNTFKFDNKKHMLFLSLALLLFLVLFLMAVDVNKYGSAGAVSIGSGAVRESSSGAGSETGSGFTVNVSDVTIPSPGSTVTTLTTQTTLPNHCFNGVQDSFEDGVDCGGGCVECHCFNLVQDGDETGRDCGGSCLDVCECDPTGLNSQCSFGWCCLEKPTTLLGCEYRCVKPLVEGRININPPGGWNDIQLQNFCGDDCVNYNFYTTTDPTNGSTVNNSGKIDWY